MALARIQYEADGNTDTFSLTFPYISKDDIKVSLDGDSTTAFTWPSSSSIKLDTTPESGTIVDIKRETERNNILVDFQDGSTLLESDLDLAARQSFYLAQESFDQTGSTLAVAEDGSYSASSRRISSMGYPSESDDASTKSYVDDIFAQGEDAYAMAAEAEHWANYPEDDLVPEGDGVDDYSALHHKNKSQAAQAASEAARDKSELWAEEAEDVEVETGAYSSKHHSIKSSDSASAAATSESNAATSESNAATSESNAAASETNAADSESKAQLWAEESEDVEVETGEYSAYHWSKKAEGWASGVNMPSADGNGGKLIRQAADESGFEYMTQSEARAAISVYSQAEADGEFVSKTGDVTRSGGDLTQSFSGFVAENSGGNWFSALVTDDSNSGVFRLKDSGGNIVASIISKNLDGQGGGQSEFSGDWTFQNMPYAGGDLIVESGSNSDGEWIRWADGTQQCWSQSITNDDTSSTAENLTWPLPIDFIDGSISGFIFVEFDEANSDIRSSVVNARRGSTNSSTFAVTIVGTTGNDFGGQDLTQCEGFATGRWK